MTSAQERLIQAVFYALREGCLHPVKEPKPSAGVRAWVQWGAMHHLHEAMAEYDRSSRTK